MIARFPDRPITAETAPGQRGAPSGRPYPSGPVPRLAGGRSPRPVTGRGRHRWLRRLGRDDRNSLYAVLDAGLVAHLGMISCGWPVVVPAVYGFTADTGTLYLHGPVAGQGLDAAGARVCVTVTVTGGSAGWAVGYRSALIYGRARLVTDPAEKLAALHGIREHAAAGQRDQARRPGRDEPATAGLLAVSLDEASVKVRTGPPDDRPAAGLSPWAGGLSSACVRDVSPVAWLRVSRQAAGLTQEELAERSGLAVRTISDLERGVSARPYPRSIKMLVNALGLPQALADEVIAQYRDGARKQARGAPRQPVSGQQCPGPEPVTITQAPSCQRRPMAPKSGTCSATRRPRVQRLVIRG
jgi:nitroimidazol reductase NimA-like FMN-containing flavoprotein (pyridoxamine 5'-phosphate oxidase superfamily)